MGCPERKQVSTCLKRVLPLSNDEIPVYLPMIYNSVWVPARYKLCNAVAELGCVGTGSAGCAFWVRTMGWVVVPYQLGTCCSYTRAMEGFDYDILRILKNKFGYVLKKNYD